MAQLEILEATEESFEVLQELVDQITCNPCFKAQEVDVFNRMMVALRAQFDEMVAPYYWAGDDETLQSYKKNIDDMARLMRQLIQEAERSRQG